MQCLSIALQNPCEFAHLLVSSAHRKGETVQGFYACALETCASTQILCAFESHERNALHKLG